MTKRNLIEKEEGMALVIALVMLLILTIVGINAITTTTFETNVAGNQRIYNTAFYGADGGIDDFRARAPHDPLILDGTKTTYSQTIPGSNTTYRITATILGEVNRGGVLYQVFRVHSEGVAPNFPTAGRVSVETLEEIDTSGGSNVAEVRKYN
jgi:hypothetical protein